jgi:hypothetical protein
MGLMVFNANIDNNILIKIVNSYLFLLLKYGWNVYEIKAPNKSTHVYQMIQSYSMCVSIIYKQYTFSQ